MLAPARVGIRSLGRFGQMRPDPCRHQLLDDVPPPGAALDRKLDGDPGKLGQPGPQPLPVGGEDPPPADLAGLGVDVVESDLLPVHVQAAYDCHGDLLMLLTSARSSSCLS